MRKYLFVCIFLAIALPSQAQQFSFMKKYEEAELREALAGAGDDSLRARLNYLLSFHWALIAPEKGKPYLKEASELSKAYPFLNDVHPFYEANLIWDEEPARSEALFLKTDTILQKYRSPEAWFLRAKSWRNYALHQQAKDNKDAFIEAILKAIPLSEQSGDSSFTGLLYQDVAMVFMNQGQYEKAEEYYAGSISLHKNSQPDKKNLAEAFAQAIRNLVYLEKLAEAQKMLTEAKEVITSLPVSDTHGELFLSEGMLYHALKEYKQSIASYDEGLAAIAGLNQSYLANQLTYQKYVSYRDMHDHVKALEVLKGVYDNGEVLTIHNRMRLYTDFAETYKGLGNFREAYEWQERYSALSDSVHKAEIRQRIVDMEAKFQDAQKEKAIQLLREQKTQADLSAKNSRLYNWLLGIGCLLFLLVGVSSFLLYRKNKKIAEQKLTEIQQSHKLRLAQAMLEGEERERQRVARDLHDGLGGMLAGIKLRLSGQLKTTSPDNPDSVIMQLDRSLSELRRIARNMMPESLLKVGLEGALRDLCDSLTNAETRIEFQAYGIRKDMPAATQVTIYRIGQELLSNAVRHAQASEIILQCSQNEDRFFITAEDNGKGFDPSSIEKTKGIGLDNIRKRVEYLKGEMEITSAPHEGATINIELNVTG